MNTSKTGNTGCWMIRKIIAETFTAIHETLRVQDQIDVIFDSVEKEEVEF